MKDLRIAWIYIFRKAAHKSVKYLFILTLKNAVNVCVCACVFEYVMSTCGTLRLKLNASYKAITTTRRAASDGCSLTTAKHTLTHSHTHSLSHTHTHKHMHRVLRFLAACAIAIAFDSSFIVPI